MTEPRLRRWRRHWASGRLMALELGLSVAVTGLFIDAIIDSSQPGWLNLTAWLGVVLVYCLRAANSLLVQRQVRRGDRPPPPPPRPEDSFTRRFLPPMRADEAYGDTLRRWDYWRRRG